MRRSLASDARQVGEATIKKEREWLEGSHEGSGVQESYQPSRPEPWTDDTDVMFITKPLGAVTYALQATRRLRVWRGGKGSRRLIDRIATMIRVWHSVGIIISARWQATYFLV